MARARLLACNVAQRREERESVHGIEGGEREGHGLRLFERSWAAAAFKRRRQRLQAEEQGLVPSHRGIGPTAGGIGPTVGSNGTMVQKFNVGSKFHRQWDRSHR